MLAAASPLHIVSKATLEFKSSSFNIPVLVLNSDSLIEIKKELVEKISQAPDFFKNSPLIIDLNLAVTQYLSIESLVQTLRQLQFFPIGVQSGTSKQHESAANIGLPILSVKSTNSLKLASKPAKVINTEDLETNEQLNNTPIIETKLITHPVRSGQRVDVGQCWHSARHPPSTRTACSRKACEGPPGLHPRCRRRSSTRVRYLHATLQRHPYRGRRSGVLDTARVRPRILHAGAQHCRRIQDHNTLRTEIRPVGAMERPPHGHRVAGRRRRGHAV